MAAADELRVPVRWSSSSFCSDFLSLAIRSLKKLATVSIITPMPGSCQADSSAPDIEQSIEVKHLCRSRTLFKGSADLTSAAKFSFHVRQYYHYSSSLLPGARPALLSRRRSSSRSSARKAERPAETRPKSSSGIRSVTLL